MRLIKWTIIGVLAGAIGSALWLSKESSLSIPKPKKPKKRKPSVSPTKSLSGKKKNAAIKIKR